MKDTKTSGAAKKIPAKTGAKTAAPKTAAKPAPKSQAAKTAAKDKAKTPAPKVGKDVAKTARPAAKPAAKPIDKAAVPKAAMPELKKGDYFKFGSYYQENSSKKTPIEWLVLKKSGSKVLLISRYALDWKNYHYKYVDITWENCDLRKWLNGDFLRNAFTAAEQKKIAVTKLANDNNAQYGTFGGNSTEDRVFLLSLAEAGRLFKDDAARKCAPTPYAVGKGAWQSNEIFINGRACCYWWLRSPGKHQSYVSFVFADGALGPGGSIVNGDINAVRPALWVNL
jgi:hypothetical protein